MGSKTILFVGLLLAVFLMMSSKVVARELAETSSVKLDNENDAEVDGYHGGGYYKGGGYHKGGGYRKGGFKKCPYKCYGRCCSYEQYVAMGKVTEAKPQN